LKIEKELGAQNKMQLGNYKAVLLKSGHGDFLKKRHRIAVAWRVSNGGAMAVMAAWWKITFSFCFFLR